jgi:hypothetical protein
MAKVLSLSTYNVVDEIKLVVLVIFCFQRTISAYDNIAIETEQFQLFVGMFWAQVFRRNGGICTGGDLSLALRSPRWGSVSVAALNVLDDVRVHEVGRYIFHAARNDGDGAALWALDTVRALGGLVSAQSAPSGLGL